MTKVINIVTRLEETELPLDAQGAKDLLSHLIEYKALNRSSMSYGEHFIMTALIRMVENNSGLQLDAMLEEKAGS